ncbi:hypothetical protein Tco_1408851 [Tanacetum coccineum]
MRKTNDFKKQLKKANASLTQELKECKTNLDESSRALGEATSSRDSSLIALQTKQTELEKYTALNDLTNHMILQPQTDFAPMGKRQCSEKEIVQLILFIVDSGCTKHMTGNLKLLCNFVEKFLGTVRFGNDQFAPILGYEDLIQGNVTSTVYYVDRPHHNLFSLVYSVYADMEVAFKKSTCFVRISGKRFTYW